MLEGRRILLGITGGVAAYKSAYLARRLVERKANVRTVMTPAAEHFIGVQTMAALTGEPVNTDLFEPGSVSPHTELGRWAEAVVVAPATTHLIARLAHGLANDLLTSTLLATRAPVLLAPAMHTEMWEHPATQRNLEVVRLDGYRLVGPVSGELAGGDTGMGRMAEPDDILADLEKMLVE